MTSRDSSAEKNREPFVLYLILNKFNIFRTLFNLIVVIPI